MPWEAFEVLGRMIGVKAGLYRELEKGMQKRENEGRALELVWSLDRRI